MVVTQYRIQMIDQHGREAVNIYGHQLTFKDQLSAIHQAEYIMQCDFFLLSRCEIILETVRC